MTKDGNGTTNGASPHSRVVAYAKLLRVHHWVKSFLVLFPVVFSGNLFTEAYLVQALLAFLAFSLGASAIYINNDLRDVEADRLHPTKCTRPIASGAVSPRAAKVLLAITLVGAIALTAVFGGMEALAILIAYAALNIAYSAGLKDKPVADIAILASGFVLRVLYGGAFCGIPVSLWLFLTILAFAVYFSLGKRKGELVAHGTASRKSLEGYTVPFLASSQSAFLALGLTFYSLWSYEHVAPLADTVSLGALLVVLGVPLVMLICLRYGYDIDKPRSDGDPVSVLTADKWLAVLLVLWAATVIVSIYILGI